MKHWKNIGLGAITIFGIACILYGIMGCAPWGIKPWAERSPQEKSMAFMAFYNSQYQDAMRLATNPNSTPAQKRIAMDKKAVLKELWPLIGAYDSYASGGLPLTPALEQKILSLINKLGGEL